MGKHCLAIWMDEQSISQTTFAERVGCSASHLSLMLRGERGSSYRLAKLMSQATAGSISVEQIYADSDRLLAKRRTAESAA